MEQLEDWGRLLAELPGMVRFALIFGGVVSIATLGCLIAIAIQLGRMIEVMREAAPKSNQPTFTAPGSVPYGPNNPYASNNPYHRPKQRPAFASGPTPASSRLGGGSSKAAQTVLWSFAARFRRSSHGDCRHRATPPAPEARRLAVTFFES